MSWMRILIFWLGGSLILHDTMCFQELHVHVLAILVSIVALESAFSTTGRVLDPIRSSLSSLMVEALICGQNWLCPSSAPISLCAAMDNVEEFEKLDGGMTIICYIKKKYEFLLLKKKKKLNVLGS